jgi:membrane protein implicated in regulation of membrane protease activity
VLLAVGGAYVIWRSIVARSAPGVESSDALLRSWLAIVGFLIGALALLTAASAALSLRRRSPERTLRLRDLARRDGGPATGRESSRSVSGSKLGGGPG